MLITKSILLYIAAGLSEIGGGNLDWLWLLRAKESVLRLPSY